MSMPSVRLNIGVTEPVTLSSPATGSTMPAMTRTWVVLPAPLWSTRPTRGPCSSWYDTSPSALPPTLPGGAARTAPVAGPRRERHVGAPLDDNLAGGLGLDDAADLGLGAARRARQGRALEQHVLQGAGASAVVRQVEMQVGGLDANHGYSQ